MTVQYDVTSEVQSTAMATFQKGPIIPDVTAPYITVPSGTTAVQGTLAGSPLFPLGQGAANLSWYTPGNANATAQWELDDETAVDTAISNLLAQIEAGTEACVLSSDGSVSAAS